MWKELIIDKKEKEKLKQIKYMLRNWMSLVCEMWMCAYRYRHAADRGAPNDQTLDML